MYQRMEIFGSTVHQEEEKRRDNEKEKEMQEQQVIRNSILMTQNQNRQFQRGKTLEPIVDIQSPPSPPQVHK